MIFNKQKNKYHELISITHASSGMNVRKQSHVVYATKTPVIEKFQDRHSKKFGFPRFYEKYQDIIMSVGVNINVEDGTVENRGIFRNPLSIIWNDYRGIAMLLHDFTCQTICQFFQSVHTFYVRPMQKMAAIMFNTLDKSKLTIDYEKALDFKKDFCCERVFSMPIQSFKFI